MCLLQVPVLGSKPHCSVFRSFATQAPIRIAKEKSLLPCRQLQNIDGLKTSMFPFYRNPLHFSSDTAKTQVATKKCGSLDSADGSISRKGRNKLDVVIKLKCLLHVAAFSVRALNQIEQWAVLDRTLRTFRNAHTGQHFCVHSLQPKHNHFFLASLFACVVIQFWGLVVRLALRSLWAWVELALLDWIAVNIRLCEVQLGGSVRANSIGLKGHCLFFVFVCA